VIPAKIALGLIFAVLGILIFARFVLDVGFIGNGM